jgi:hypothetical protein
MHSPMALARMYAERGLNQLNSSPSRVLFNMDLVIAFVVAFAVGFGAGYATRERKSRRRRPTLIQRIGHSPFRATAPS